MKPGSPTDRNGTGSSFRSKERSAKRRNTPNAEIEVVKKLVPAHMRSGDREVVFLRQASDFLRVYITKCRNLDSGVTDRSHLLKSIFDTFTLPLFYSFTLISKRNTCAVPGRLPFAINMTSFPVSRSSYIPRGS